MRIEQARISGCRSKKENVYIYHLFHLNASGICRIGLEKKILYLLEKDLLSPSGIEPVTLYMWVGSDIVEVPGINTLI